MTKSLPLAASALALILALGGCDGRVANGAPARVEATGALCRPTIAGRDRTGCYLTLTASQNDRLKAVSSPVAGQGQIHEMAMTGNVMSMRELPDGLPLPAGEAVSLRPGGNHLMLIDLRQPLPAGTSVLLTLTFEHAEPLTVRARVEQPPLPGAAHDGHG